MACSSGSRRRLKCRSEVHASCLLRLFIACLRYTCATRCKPPNAAAAVPRPTPSVSPLHGCAIRSHKGAQLPPSPTPSRFLFFMQPAKPRCSCVHNRPPCYSCCCAHHSSRCRRHRARDLSRWRCACKRRLRLLARLHLIHQLLLLLFAQCELLRRCCCAAAADSAANFSLALCPAASRLSRCTCTPP